MLLIVRNSCGSIIKHAFADARYPRISKIEILYLYQSGLGMTEQNDEIKDSIEGEIDIWAQKFKLDVVCLITADWFYEWARKEGKKPIPYRVVRSM